MSNVNSSKWVYILNLLLFIFNKRSLKILQKKSVFIRMFKVILCYVCIAFNDSQHLNLSQESKTGLTF